MRLLFIIHSLRMGGAERVLSIMANQFAKSGYEVDIAVFDGAEPFYELDKKIRVFDLALDFVSASIFEALKNNFLRILSVRSKIKELKPNIVISFLTHTNIASILAAKSVGAKIIASEHSNFWFVKSRLWRWVRALTYRLADAVTVLTIEDAKNYRFLKNLEILPNPVLDPNSSSIHREPIVLGVGRLCPEKGFDRLIDAFSRADTGDWRLIIAGDGVLKKELLTKIESSPKKERIALAGARKDVESFYNLASLFVLSSKEEGFPMALCEAMAHGVAPISFDCVAGPSEIITNGEDGVLVKEGDVLALANAISELIANRQKRELIANKATKITGKLGIDNITAKWEHIFAKLEK